MIELSLSIPSFQLAQAREVLDGETRKISRAAEKLPDGIQEREPDESFFTELKRVGAREQTWDGFFQTSRHTVSKVASAYGLFLGTKGSRGESLPPFERELVERLIRSDESSGGKGLRQLTLLYFKRFSDLPHRAEIGSYLGRAWMQTDRKLSGLLPLWKEFSSSLFCKDAVAASVGHLGGDEEFRDFVLRLGVPLETQFEGELQLQYFVRKLEEVSAEEDAPELWNEVINRKKSRVSGERLGILAARTMIQRVQLEFAGRWPKKWRNYLVPISSDPRFRDPIWWGWASEEDWKTANAALIERTIELFVKVVENTSREATHQWASREAFLRKLFEHGKIQSIWVMLNKCEISKLNSEVKASLRPVPVDSKISFVYVQCEGGIEIIEGSANCKIRAWRTEAFPYKTLFARLASRGESTSLNLNLKDRDFRKPPNVEVERNHHGEWSYYFLRDVSDALGVELMDY